MKRLICLLIAVLLLTVMTACHKTQPADTSPAFTAQPAPAETQDADTTAEPQAPNPTTASAEADTPASNESGSETEIGRQDGERFETVIVLEGMEETVRYEHVRNEAIGFEMDYDYESFERRSEADRECFISIYDNAENPENYLEVTCSPEDADTVAVSVSEALSQDYDLIREWYTLDRAGGCTRIEASELKGTGKMADQLQVVYIIPAADGCLVAAAHYSIEGAEGFGRRFAYMMNTLAVLGSREDGIITNDQAVSAIREYCYTNDPSLEEIVNAGEYPVYWEVSSGSEDEIVVLFRSYTGAMIRYYIDPVSGETHVTEFVPGISSEEEWTDESFNARDYLP